MSEPLDEVSRFLANVALFRNVKSEYLPSIARRLEEQVFARDQTVFRAGEPGDTLYLIRAGSVGVFLEDAAVGLRYELARLRTGQVFGEMALLTKQPRSATCRAMEPTSCLALSSATFMAIVERVPQVALSVAEVLAERVEQLNRERGVDRVQLTELKLDPEVYRLVPQRILSQHKMIPLSVQSGVLTLACVDVSDLAGKDEVQRIVRGLQLKTVAITEADYRAFMAKNGSALSGEAKVVRGKRLEPVSWIGEESKQDKSDAKGDDVRVLVDTIIAQAVDLEASDIHIQPELEGVVVRYRVSGALARRQGPAIPRAWGRALASRIKVLAELDISERRRPQDGRISCKVGERHFDLRVSSMPTQEGEKLVLRLLDSQQAVQPLDRLILAEKVCRVVQQMVMRPHGIIFVVGPTGSGKTTTLYSALGMRRREDTNIVSVEDPVEYSLPGVTQVSVQPEIGLTFATVLRSMLRQDPNVIMVGETRDHETGKIALEAGLTGHLVFTSLHTNDAIGTIQRLREMKLENYAIAAAMVGIVSQRLVRRVCPVCATEAPVPPHLLEQLVLAGVVARDFNQALKRPKGCETCGGTGYRGRVGVYELLVADDALKEKIIADAGQLELRATAERGAFVPMTRYSQYLLTQGITTPEEILPIHAQAIRST